MTKRTYTQLKSEFYVEVTADLAELITQRDIIDCHLIGLYQTDANGDTRYTDEAQEIFNKNLDLVTDIFEGCGIENGGASYE